MKSHEHDVSYPRNNIRLKQGDRQISICQHYYGKDQYGEPIVTAEVAVKIRNKEWYIVDTFDEHPLALMDAINIALTYTELELAYLQSNHKGEQHV